MKMSSTHILYHETDFSYCPLGVKNTSPGGKKEDILLQVSDRFNDFAISKLSDANFSEVKKILSKYWALLSLSFFLLNLLFSLPNLLFLIISKRTL